MLLLHCRWVLGGCMCGWVGGCVGGWVGGCVGGRHGICCINLIV